jgi:hypothetical protein
VLHKNLKKNLLKLLIRNHDATVLINIVNYKFEPFDIRKNGIKMEREARVYWVRRPEGEKDLLIVDAGYEGGAIYIYEHKESIEVKDIQKEAEEMLRYKPPVNELVSIWIGAKFGYPMTWRIIP